MKDVKDLFFGPIDLEVPDFGIYELGVTAQKNTVNMLFGKTNDCVVN